MDSNSAQNTTYSHRKLARKLKALKPLSRFEIRADFPPVIKNNKTDELINVLAQELKKVGKTLNSTKEIILAYPQKHPHLFPEHNNSAKSFSILLKRRLTSELPNIQFNLANGICETKKLERSRNQSSLHALTAKQVYTICAKKKHTGIKNKLFIISDHCIEQGTTIASLMSYIHHNGGRTLYATSGRTIKGSHPSILQKQDNNCEAFNTSSLPSKFTDPNKNNKKVPELGIAFNKSTQRGEYILSPTDCIIQFEKALNASKQSILSLTNGECLQIIKEVNHNITPFHKLIDTLEKKPNPLSSYA